MLHAFNIKNVRRVLATSGDEHTNDKNEDAITSMVFSPLAFMTPEAALRMLEALVGEDLRRETKDRRPVRHEMSLWPTGLVAAGWGGSEESRCEPDLVVRFEFDEGRPVLVIGEMKWDWRVSAEHLRQETDRERRSLAGDPSDPVGVVFAITKFPLKEDIRDVVQLTWVNVHGRASFLARREPKTPGGEWGRLVSGFLEQAEQMDFQGFRAGDYPAVEASEPLFWRD